MNRSLLLDPDFRSPYVNLGVAYLRLANAAFSNGDFAEENAMYRKTIEVSKAGLSRFPQSPQCHYHIAIATCQLAIARQAVPSLFLTLRSHAANALNAYREARTSPE